MWSFLESQRSILEELDVIELESSRRFRKDPLLYPQNENKEKLQIVRTKRPQKEVKLQQHELAVFQQKYKKHCNSLRNHTANDSDIIQSILGTLDDSKATFSNFDSALAQIQEKHNKTNNGEIEVAESIRNMYTMFSSILFSGEESVLLDDDIKRVRKEGKEKTKVKRKHIISITASHLDPDEIYSTEEVYGKYLDLSKFHEIYRNQTSSNVSYLEYLKVFDIFPYAERFRSSSIYLQYLRELSEYLVDFVSRAEPLQNFNEVFESIKKSYSPKEEPATRDGVENESGEVYCSVCQKVFAKISVYQGHLNGKKHKKNAKELQTATPKESIISESDLQEHINTELGKFLSNYKEATIQNTERKSAMTERERLIENTTIVGDESDYTTVYDSSSDSGNDSSDEEEHENLKHLPLGADGKPIPFWLYKLQGLHKTYNCEICGNVTYKGRVTFEKHFSAPKHQYGLKCLGITEQFVSYFRDIISINEAQDLWKRLKRDKRIKEGDIENAVEVEDAEGNVMSEKDYLDLKKQGLL
ncbi:hypothetical protein G9P44_002650 [Scheffersomyces stipitis]|nr:hypothetical protein G9P44_002650 [Scheffersomyces stipitis]